MPYEEKQYRLRLILLLASAMIISLSLSLFVHPLCMFLYGVAGVIFLLTHRKDTVESARYIREHHPTLFKEKTARTTRFNWDGTPVLNLRKLSEIEIASLHSEEIAQKIRRGQMVQKFFLISWFGFLFLLFILGNYVFPVHQLIDINP